MVPIVQKESRDITNDKTTEEVQTPKNNKNEEISRSYISMRKRWNQNNNMVDNTFAYNIN